MNKRSITSRVLLALATVTLLSRAFATQGPVAPGGDESPATPPLPGASIVIHHPVPGAIFRAPGTIVFEATAVDPKGDIRHVEFLANDTLIGTSDFLAKIATIPGNPIHHRFEWSGVQPGGYVAVARAIDTAGNPVESAPVKFQILTGGVSEAPTLIKPGSAWRLSNDGTVPAPSWTELTFDDSSWPVGPAQLGYGDGDEATTTSGAKLIPHPMTAYFRHGFEVVDPTAVGRLVVRLVRDDGAAVYLNGREVLRDNLPAGPLTHLTPATQTAGDENAFRRFVLPAEGLVAGRNLLAVEVHQSSPSSSDLSFDLELLSLTSAPEGLPLVSVEASRRETTEPGPTVRVAPGQFTLRRTGDASGTLTVWVKTEGTATAKRDYAPLPEVVTFPAGQSAVELDVVALADSEEEGVESVVLQVTESPLDSLPAYRVDADRSAAKVAIHNTAQMPVLRLAITSPAEGAAFGLGEAIPIKAVAVDPAGYLPRVEFLADDRSIGFSELTFIQAPPAGQPIHHQFTWKDAAAGNHTLLARAISATGEKLESAPVRVVVGSEPKPTLVTVVSRDPEAHEWPDADGGPNAATFTLQRHGAVDIDLPVFFSLAGSARDGVDFAAVGDHIVIPKGEDSVTIVIKPVDDAEAEGTETVVLQVQPPACPLIFPPPPTCYRVGEPSLAKVLILDGDRPKNRAPRVELTQPRNGATLVAPADVLIIATASDPDGLSTLKRVEFFADGRSLGIRENLPVMNPIGPFVLTWKDVPAGSHKLTATATDDHGATSDSKPVTIEVVPPGEKPSVSIVATDSEAQEPATRWSFAKPNLGVFTLTRTGSLEKALHVTYEVLGTAENGKDYVRLDGNATIRPGARTGTLYVLPLADRLTEETETIVVKLKAHEAYVLGEAPEATVAILDSPSASDEAVVRITAPENGAQFVAPATVEIHATAVDPKGFIYDLEFYADGRSIGKSSLRTLAEPPAGTQAEHRVTWEEIRPGTYWLTARADRPGHAPVISLPIRIRVTSTTEDGFVVRALPAWYAPGSPCIVHLEAEPTEKTMAYTIEDSPPVGWKITDISDEGVFDVASQKVKFGPFLDHRGRTLSYKAIAPADAKGPAEFAGIGAADGQSSSISGDQLVEAAPARHPADKSEADNRLTAMELSAYAAAWRAGTEWSIAPSPVALNYLTRAANIWRRGEVYTYEPGAGAPPLCWQPASTVQANLTAEHATAEPIGAVRYVADVLLPGQSVIVRLAVKATSAGDPFAVEERLPAGWSVTTVSDAGHWDSTHGVIRWGPFTDTKPREISYTVTPPAAAAGWFGFAGSVSFDGRDSLIQGQKQVLCSGPLSEERKPGAHRSPDGRMTMNMVVQTGPQYVIEVSDDLLDWIPVATALSEDGIVPWTDADGTTEPRRFYRAVPAR